MRITKAIAFACTISIPALAPIGAFAGNTETLPIEDVVHKLAIDGYDAHSIFCRQGAICTAAVADSDNNLLIVAVNGKTGKIFQRAIFGHAVHADIQGKEISGDAAVKSVLGQGKFKLVSMEYKSATFLVHVEDSASKAHVFQVDERDGSVMEVKN